MSELVPLGIEHVEEFTSPRLLAAAMRLVSHADAVTPNGEALDLIVVGVPTTYGDEIRQVITDALRARVDVWADGYTGEDIRADGERLEDV